MLKVEPFGFVQRDLLTALLVFRFRLIFQRKKMRVIFLPVCVPIQISAVRTTDMFSSYCLFMNRTNEATVSEIFFMRFL